MNIVCFGDSITNAGGFAEGDRWPTVLQAKLNELKPGAYKVYNRGIGGHTSAQGMDRIGNDVVPLLPGLVVVEFGFNDKHHKAPSTKARVGIDEFKANMLEICKIIKKSKGQSILVLNHCHEVRSQQQLIKQYNEAVKAVAAEMKLPLIDIPAGLKKRKVKNGDFTVADGVHLTAEGNHTYADIVLEAIKDLI